MAERFRGRRVLETCTGAGFTTIALARAAEHVTTVEIDPSHQAQSRKNVATAGLSDRVDFVSGDILDEGLLGRLPAIDAAFLDPDWAVTGPDHVFRFIDSNTRPPADRLIERILRLTANTALVLPPLLNTEELSALPEHEQESLFLDGNHELYCLYFGDLIHSLGKTEFHT
jgi:SAM-dependent methyltransferase